MNMCGPARGQENTRIGLIDTAHCVSILLSNSELEAVGVVSGGVGVTTSEAIIGDIYAEFTAAVQVFTGSEQVHTSHSTPDAYLTDHSSHPSTLSNLFCTEFTCTYLHTCTYMYTYICTYVHSKPIHSCIHVNTPLLLHSLFIP